jgi:hypothetical protein
MRELIIKVAICTQTKFTNEICTRIVVSLFRWGGGRCSVVKIFHFEQCVASIVSKNFKLN